MRSDKRMGEELSGRFRVERRILALSRPHGVVGRDRLIEAGIAPKLIDNRVEARWLRPLHRGVYAVGPVQSDDAPYLAAVLACGDGAVLGHRAAGYLWGLIRHRPRGPVDVLVALPRCPRHRGIRVHRVRPLSPDELTRLRKIAVTTPARTLLDLAAELTMRELERALAIAERKRAGTKRRLLTLVERHPRRPGVAKLRKLVDEGGRPALTRSEAEDRFLALVRRGDLPAPECNIALHRYELDFLWREAGLAVEIDGFAFHGDRDAFEADRRRDSELAARGIQVMRITWRQIAAEPEATLVRLAQALAARA